MPDPHVYDKAKYHAEAVEEAGLPEEHAGHHTVVFLRWLIEQNLMSDFFREECVPQLAEYRAGKLSIHQLYQWWDGCLISVMLSEEGNAFAMSYFNFDKGEYLADYRQTLQKELPSEYHVPYTEDNYRLMKEVIDRRYAARQNRAAKPRWKFW